MVEEYQAKLKNTKLNLLQLQMLSTETVLKKFKICRKELTLEIMLKELQQKESDIVKPLMEKVRNSIQKLEKLKVSNMY
jgi:outer membrane protein